MARVASPWPGWSHLCHGQGGLASATAEVEEPVPGPQGGVHGGEVCHGGGVDHVVSLAEVYRGGDHFVEYFGVILLVLCFLNSLYGIYYIT